MSFGWKRAVLTGVVALVLGSAAQAADLEVIPGSTWYNQQEQISEYGNAYLAPAEPRQHWREGRFYNHREHDRFYGRHVAENRPWARPDFARPAWSHGQECRLIIKERVSPWGERVVRRIRVCD
ncbi:hypothetical protein MAE02_63690 [Microvirga aerophila]|uniref:Uncharacterized protein n=1 Tax=Microvirga aerophila TaxID=670291 RepID=A0A512C381_9HYPH|nr:hypothetical protein MAE02_63690 [Microvirga aerophila]